MRNQKTRIILYLPLVLLMIIVACGANETSTTTSEPYPTTEDKVVEDRVGSYVVYPTFAELVSKSDIIVIARIKSTLDIVNMARDMDDRSQPDPNYFGIGQVYELEIDNYLKGEGLETIYYIENQGFISTSGQPTAEDIEKEKSQALAKDYIPLQANQTYLLFLRIVNQGYQIGSYDAGSLFAGTGHPWQFNLADPNCIWVEDIIQEMALYFPLQPLTKILDHIENPVESDVLPYPYPEANLECLKTPYP
jgi:hypothetical protein